MAIERIEEYRQQNGVDILKVHLTPNKAAPLGKNYFYTSADAREVVYKYRWRIHNAGSKTKSLNVTAEEMLYEQGKCIGAITRLFHREMYFFYNSKYTDYIDHINSVDIDNADSNLNSVSGAQNIYNKFHKGYSTTKATRSKRNYVFIPCAFYNNKAYTPFGSSVKVNEDEVCVLQNIVERVWLKERLKNDYYMFDFKRYRRNSEDILDLERTGQISEDEAVYRHILRYAYNPWYILRFGLEGYCKENHIPIPAYSLDSDGFMVHPITGVRLCPFIK